MAINDEFDALDKAYPRDETAVSDAVENVASVALAAASVAVPLLAVPSAVLSVWTRLKDGKAFEARTNQTLDLIVERLKSYEPIFDRLTKENKNLAVRVNDLEAAVRVGVWQDGITADDNKRVRLIAVISNATISETKIADLTSFVKNIDELNEQDIIALRVLNRIMNKPGDWNNVQPNQAGLHPNTFLQRDQELATNMSQALGKDVATTPTNSFSREEGLGLCLRLQGFGLAEVLTSNSRSVPRANYVARLTPRGMMLLKLLGDDVPNWEHYFDANGPL